MNDDKTILVRANPQQQQPVDTEKTVLNQAQTLQVNLFDAAGNRIASYSFADRFNVGRAADNAISIENILVSRHHMEVKWELGCYWLYNLKSTHGVFLNDALVQEKIKLNLPTTVVLGGSGYLLEIQAAKQVTQILHHKPTPSANSFSVAASLPAQQIIKAKPALSAEEVRNRLLNEAETDDMGEHTIMVRRLIREDRAVRSKSYKKVIWLLGVLFVLSATLVTYQHFALANARLIAINMFYDIKTLEVNLSQADVRLESSAKALSQTMQEISGERLKAEQERAREEQQKILEEKQRLAQEREKLKAMKAKYESYLNEINFLRISFPSDERYEKELITRVARGFGESELEVPDDFVAEVQKYIKLWQSSGRMQMAMKRLEENHYAPVIVDALEKQGLPTYFIYLPLQESNFDPLAIGPETRFGVAKGAWQFLATTGSEYGLASGPLANSREFDAQDSRFDFAQATQAGAKYLKYIYSTQAQASGLLVMASYNYGHNKVKSMIAEMPDNPRDKNFWKFIQQYEIPKETYDYVFYIFSAAVIGEDPKHFGFDFTPPTLYLSKQTKV